MPMIQVNMVKEAATPEKKAELIRAIARATHDTLDAPWPSIRVWINDLDRATFVVGTEVEQELASQSA